MCTYSARAAELHTARSGRLSMPRSGRNCEERLLRDDVEEEYGSVHNLLSNSGNGYHINQFFHVQNPPLIEPLNPKLHIQ